MQQCHQNATPVGIIYAAKAASTHSHHPILASKSVLEEAASDGFAFVPLASLNQLAQDNIEF